MKKIIKAKDLISLKEHSNRVELYAEAILNNFIDLNLDEEILSEIRECVKLTSMLHDIGKATENFQNILNNNFIKSKESKFRHNEIGWAFLQKYLNHKYKNNISAAVYWHHGISNSMNYYNVDEILNGIDISSLEIILKEFIDEKYICKNIDSRNTLKSPLYFSDDERNNNINLIIRTCVISADRIVSELEDNIINKNNIKDIDNPLINSQFPIAKLFIEEYLKKNSIDITTPYNNERYNLQLEIGNNNLQTAIINATTGFGKSVIGLIFSKKTNNKLIWVCPRNSIANSVYDRILYELNALGINNIKIELYLTGNVVKSNHNSNGFDSDIIIINIDNYLKPIIDNSNMDRLYTILAADVIFDEYDELSSDAALFACFINIMQTRHKYTKSRTLLLSATNIMNINDYWDNPNKLTGILPEKNKHYPAPHNKDFKLTVTDDINCIDLSESDKLVVTNSISLSQELHKKNKDNTILIHSEFENDKKEKIFDSILNIYGKDKIKNKDSLNVVSTNIIQASFDISFKKVYEIIISPASTCQRGGRNDRWGEDENPELIIIKSNNKSENALIKQLYDEKLLDKWYNFVLLFNGKFINSDKLYELYNSFQKENEIEINNFISKKYNESLRNLMKIYPIKYNSENKKSDIMNAGSNKLRTTNSEVFIIAKKYNSQEYCNPFTVKLYNDSFEKTFKEDDNISKSIIKEMKLLKNDKRFNYSEIFEGYKKKDPSIETIQKKYSKKSNTPYIRFDKIYHEDYGFINEKFLK